MKPFEVEEEEGAILAVVNPGDEDRPGEIPAILISNVLGFSRVLKKSLLYLA
jgi:hypothetical protein